MKSKAPTGLLYCNYKNLEVRHRKLIVDLNKFQLLKYSKMV